MQVTVGNGRYQNMPHPNHKILICNLSQMERTWAPNIHQYVLRKHPANAHSRIHSLFIGTVGYTLALPGTMFARAFRVQGKSLAWRVDACLRSLGGLVSYAIAGAQGRLDAVNITPQQRDEMVFVPEHMEWVVSVNFPGRATISYAEFIKRHPECAEPGIDA